MLPQAALRSLAQQAEALLKKIEYHPLGNHLLANAKALLFAGAFFSGASAAWLRAGENIWTKQVRERVLEDGGHMREALCITC